MVADFNDASSEDEMARNKALELKVRNKVPNKPAQNSHCDCGELIPEKRRIAGYNNCVHCQNEIEISHKYFKVKK